MQIKCALYNFQYLVSVQVLRLSVLFYSILDLWSDDQDEGRWPGKSFSVLIAEASMDYTKLSSCVTFDRSLTGDGGFACLVGLVDEVYFLYEGIGL